MFRQIKDVGVEIETASNDDLILIQQADDTTGRITRSNFLSGISSENSSTKYIQLLDKRASGTNGGTPVTGSWNNRIINTIASDQTSLATLSANNFGLPFGNYFINTKAAFYRPYEVQLRLFNITDNASLLTGINNYVGNVDGGVNTSLSGFFTVEAGKSLAIQYRCNNAITSIGLGLANNFGDEIYLIADIWKL